MSEPTFLERWGLRRLDGIDIDCDVPAALRKGKMAVWLGGLVGFFFSGLIAVFEIFYFEDPFRFHDDYGLHAALYIGAAILFTAAEIYFLLLFGLGAVAAFVSTSPEAHPETARRALCRAVIELPEPNVEVRGLSASKFRKKSSKIVWFILYRIKYMASTFIAKMIARRLLTRAGMRGYAPLAAAPVVALWNAWVMAYVLREVKHRLVGQHAVRKLATSVEKLTEDSQTVFDMFLAYRFVSFGRYSHNLHWLLDTRAHATGKMDIKQPTIVDVEQAMESLPPAEREALRPLFQVLIGIKRGYLLKPERRLIEATGLQMAAIKEIRREIAALEYDSIDGFLITEQKKKKGQRRALPLE